MKKKNNGVKYVNFALSFGLTLIIATYFLYVGGKWLDERLGTEPIFLIAGVLLAVATVFRQIVSEIKDMDKDKE